MTERLNTIWAISRTSTRCGSPAVGSALA